MYNKIGVLGEPANVLGFGALGFDIHPVEDDCQAQETFRQLLRSRQYAILYVTESLAAPLKQEIDRLKRGIAPAVILIPAEAGDRA